MGTIAEQINYLADTKTAIKEAIVAKGVNVAETDTFRSYADKIGQIQSGGGSTMEYWGIPADFSTAIMRELCGFFVLGKFIDDWENAIVSTGFVSVMPNSMIAVAFDPNIKMVYPGVGSATARELLAQVGVTDLSEVGLTPMTEEEFYSVS